ncbi:class I SAM-dependent methyltransferase [Pseudonocardia sp. KRD-169]|uniref:Class I SAM-dependent methyltransferase n=1 Tax=Pseudonocardia abyssalis TaxID=2792008 RepID=A0ABS6UQ82_9PSEU|nr:class I SAM-dependent methyltransferase [Pseudonocardia abyssalis]MBW0133949.1 class I SAM-dependent methyltransferase [Pseudonocardia abyssalis]
MRAARPVTPAGILARELDELSRLLDDLVHPATAARLRRAATLAGGLDPYVGRCTTPESPALAALARRTRERDWDERSGDGVVLALEQEMLSGHVEGRLLAFLVHVTRARRVLEIGMFTGYSALAMAEALPDGGELVACEIDADVARLAQECFAASPCGARISVRVAPALDTLRDLAAEGARFDLVFVDADKAGYPAYLDALLGRDDGDTGLLAPGGTVAVDNTLMQGEPWLPDEPSANGAAIAAFNSAVARDARIEQVLVPLRDGLTLIRRV